MKQAFSAVICSLNSKYVHSSLAPWYLFAGIEKFSDEKITAKVVEGTINEQIGDVAKRILAERPLAAGFCCYIWNITFVKRLTRIIKTMLPDCTIVLGGPEVSFNSEQIFLEEPQIDYIISGEGEKPFALLLNAILKGESCHDIPGVCYKASGQIVIVPPYISNEDPPSPYSEEYFKALKGRIAYIETSRGCPYSCAFCLSGRCGSVRYFDLERVKKELVLLAGSGSSTVKLIDRTFNANRARAIEIIRFIIEQYGCSIPYGVRFHFEIAGDLVDDELIALLSSAPAGSVQFEIGLQSFNEKTLSCVNRKTDVARLMSNITRLVLMKNLHIHIDLIAGLPYEDLNSFAASFNTAYNLGANILQLGFLKLLHGSTMRENPESFPCRYSKEPPYEVLETPWLTSDEIIQLHHTEDALERLYNSGRFRHTLQFLLKQTGDTPYALFSKFGAFCAEMDTCNISLDAYTKLIFLYFGQPEGIDRGALRDIMVCDRLSTNPSGKLPAILRIDDPKLKSAIRKTEGHLKKQEGIRRGYALLYSKPCLIYAEYVNRDQITGAYPLFQIDSDTLQSKILFKD